MTENLSSISYPPNLSLYPFQEKAISEMIHFLNTNESNAVYNTCFMGMGKSIQAIVAGNSLPIHSILIICPASVILNWVTELKKWSTTLYNYLPILKGTDLKHISRPAFNCVVISYDMAKTVNGIKSITSRKWDLLILDELHKCAGRATQRTKAILGPIWDASKYRIGLSGTPIQNSVIDAYAAFSKFAPSVFKNFYEFANLFAYKDRTPWGDRYYGLKNADKLKKIIRDRFFIRYTPEEVGLDLPKKTFTKIILPQEYSLKVPKSDEEILKAEVETIRLAIENGKAVPAVPVTVAGQRREQALKKLPPVISFIQDILEQGIPAVVFAYHTEVIRLLETSFETYKPSVIVGATSSSDRDKGTREFQEGKTNLFIGQIIAAGQGITLTRASTLIFAELDWSAANVSQAIARINRIGAVHPSNIYYFSIEKSLEERLIDTIVRKTKVFTELMDKGTYA